MDDLKVENAPLNVIPVTEYDPFEAKFAASLYWLVFRATEDGEFENIPSQVTSPIQRDSEKRITVRPEVTEFLTSGEVYCKVCNSIFHSKVPVVGHWAILQMLSRHGFYVVEEGDIAVTDSALQQRKPFRKSTHLALMDCLMSAFSSQAVTVQQVVQSVSKFSSFSASKELPFDLEDALLLWMNKICSILNDDQLKKQKQHAEQLLQNQDKAKRFRFRRDQLQPKVQTEFPVMEDLLKDISDGQTLLGIIMFYHPTVINLEDIRFDKNLSTKDCVHNLDLFRSLCSQFICTSVLALKLEDILYGSQAMKPNVIALLAEIFHKCEVESYSTENGVTENQTSKPEVHLHQLVANKENDMDNKSSSAPVLNTDGSKINEQRGLRELLKSKHERLGSSSKDHMEQVKSGIWKSQSDGQVNSNSASSFKSPFHLDFTVDDDMEQPPMNGPDMKRDVSENVKEKENPFSGIFQRPVLAGDRKRSLPNMPGLEGSPRTTPRQEHSLLARRNKQKQRTLDLEEWDVQQEEVEDKGILQRYLQELNLNDLQRSQSLTGLDKAKVEPRQSFHAWREDTGASLSDTNLTSSRSERISINFRPNLSTGAPQRGPEELNMSIKSSGSKATAHAAPDSLSSNDSLNVKQHGDSILSGVRDSCMSDISTKELNQFEEIEAAILAGRSVETPRTFAKPKNRLLKAVVSEEDEDEFNTSVSSEDMNMFRLEVLQRLTEDKLRQIPDGAEMEDDDDPILLARNNAASGSGNLPDQRTRLEVQDTPTDVPIDQLSPITETAEPVVSNLNSVSSANSTAPSSPCSPLDVAPFMPAFFTTSPASTLDRKNQRLGMKGREDTEETLVGEEDDFPDDPETSATPRFKPRSRNESRDFLPQSKSFEHLARGSYTVGHVSVESAKAAGLPVIGGGCSVTEAECSAVVSADPVFEPGKRVFNEEFIGRPNASTSSSVQREPSEVFNNREFSQKQTDSRQDLSGIRPLVLSSGDVEPIGVTAEVLDGRRDSLESSPAHSPALALGKRDHAYEEAVMRSREMTAQESPSDVVIFERSLASFGAPDNNLHGPFNSQTRENAPCNSGDLPASNKAEAYVFDFNQVAIHHYKNGHTTQDFRTYKKSKQAGPPESKVSQANLRAAFFHEETANQGLHRSQHEAPFGTYNKQAGTPESKVPQANLRAASFHEETANQGLHRSQHEAHFGTYNKQAGPPESKVPQANLRAASFHEETANQGLHRSQQEAYFGTYNKHSHFASQEQSRISHLRTSDTKEADSVDGRYRQRSSEDAPLGRVYVQGVRQSDGFSTFRKDTSSQQKIGATESDSGAHMLEMRRSDGFTTFRKGETTIVSVTSGRKPDDHIADQFAGEDLCHARAQDGLQHFYSASASEHVDLRQAPPVYDITPRPLPSSGGETDIQTSSRGRQEELVRTSVPSNITRSRTFRKTPDGQIIKDHNIYANSSSASSASDNSKLAGQQTVITSIRGSPEGAGSDNPHRISWTDESEAGARLVRQHNASGDRSESPTNRTGRRGSPRQSGRGSPGARISWLIAAKNGVGGQVMLNDKGCMQKDTGKKLSRPADDSSAYNSPHFMTTAFVGSDTLNQGDEFPWRHEPPAYSGPHTPSHVGPHVSHTKERTPDMESETLLNGNVLTDASTFVNNDSKPPEDLLDARSTTSELDTRAGGSIRDRIAALSAAAGVSRLNVTANREQLQVDVTPGSELSRSNVTREEKQSNVANEKGVAFDVEFQKPAKPRPPSRLVSRFRTKDMEKEYKTTFCDSQTTNIRETSAASNSENEHVNIKEIKILKNIELGAVKDKSLAFEVSFDDEPRSKRSKDEPVLLQSPFKALKTRSNRRNQQKSIIKPFEPQRSKDVEKSLICAQNGYSKEHTSKRTDYTDSVAVENTWGNVSSSEPDSQREDCIKLLKRESFTVESVSQASEHPKVKALSELANKDGPGPDATLGGQQRSSDYEESKLQKRNTFTLDSAPQCTKDAHEQGLAMTRALNELTNNEDIQTTEAKDPTSHLQKRNTYTIDSVSRKGAPVVTLLNELAVEEGNKLSNSVLPNETPQKRGTFTLDSVSHSLQNASEKGVEVACVLNDLANEEELNQREQKSDVDTSALSSEMSQKRGTFTLESVSREIDDAIEKYFPNEMAKEESTSDKKQEPSEKRSTYTLDSVSLSLQSGAQDGLPAAEVLSQLAKQCELQSVPPLGLQDSVQKRGTFTLDDVSQTLEEAQTKGLTAADVLSQLSKQEELQSLNMAGVEESVQRRGTFTLDSVSQTLDEAQQRGLPTVQALDQLSYEVERHIPYAASQEENPPQKRGTYTLDTVSHAIEEAVEMGIPVSVTLNQLAHEGKAQQHTLGHEYSDAIADEVTCDQRIPGAFVQSPEHRDEIEASFEDALEQLEDCVTVHGEESFPSSSNRMRPFSETPGNRGTYDLDDVSSSLRDGAKVGIPVVETLDRLSKNSGISRDSDKRSHESEEKRGTYTLDEVSRSIEAASEQGIPVVEALQNLTKIKVTNHESEDAGESVGKRGTYTLHEVSKSLEHAMETGIPVIEALESLSKEKRKSPLRLKMPDRGTYTLDDVSHTLEKAKQRGLPVVDALGHLTTSKDFLIRQTPDAVHRRQEKLVNRKTYALASPLETIGEGAKLRLYDGNQRQMMSPISFHVKSKEVTTSKANATENKARGLGVVQKLDFLTSACELLLEANAKEIAKDQDRTESTRCNPTSDEDLRGPQGAVLDCGCDRSGGTEATLKQVETERNTYPLETVSLTLDDAKAKGIPVVESLRNVTAAANTSTTQRTNRMRLNSKSDSELMSSGSEKERPERYTHSLENVSRTLEDAKKAGIPVIQALDQLTNDLAEFSLTAMSGSTPITQLAKDNRKRKRYSETAILRYQEQSPQPSPQGSPYPPPVRKAYSLDDVALAVKQAFQTGTSLTDLLDDMASENPAKPVSSSKDVRPRSVDSGFVSSFSDNDISSQSFESPSNRSKSYIFDSSNEDLNSAKVAASELKATSFNAEAISRSPSVSQGENRRTFTLDHGSGLSHGIPVIEALEKLSNTGLEIENSKQHEYYEDAKDTFKGSVLVNTSNPRRKKSPPKPKRQFFKKTKAPQSNSDSFVIEFFGSNSSELPITSKYQTINNKVEEVMDDIVSKTDNKDTSDTDNYRKVPLDKNPVDIELVPTRDPELAGLEPKTPLAVAGSTPTRGRAMWRPSGTVLDKIACLMDAAEDCGISPTDVLNQVTDLPCDAEGEIEESQQDEAEEEQAVTSQLAYLRMQLDEKRRHIEAEKHRTQAEWEDQRRRLGQTAFWYVIGKAQGGQAGGERPGSEALHQDQAPAMQLHFQDKSGKSMAGFPDQPSPPIAWSSPANSPLPSSVPHPAPNNRQFETREFRLSEYPPDNDLSTNPDVKRPSSQPVVEVSSRPTPISPRPSSHDPAASHHTAPTRKCWEVDVGQKATPPPLIRPETASMNLDTMQESVPRESGGTPEIEVENHSPFKKGLALFIGDDDRAGNQGLTPEQVRKREKFLRLRQKKQEEDRTRKEAELEKKRRREEKQREKEMLRRMEEEKLRQEEQERKKAEQELRLKDAQAARVPDSYATYRRAGPWQHAYNVNEDASSYIASSPSQPSSFAEFSGPQCYVKPSGKSNRKIIVNAISHVCLSGTVNQDQKERCLQAISESDGHHFMILFKDGLKFRGIYIHNLENDQLFKVFGIGPRVVTSKMLEFLYKYNSGGKEFTKIPSKTISLSVDGFAIQKSCWNTGRPVVASRTSSNLKRPPRPPQR